MEVTLTLQIFSGRPNPAWKLSAAERTELIERLNALPPGTRGVSDGGLGYSGFLLTITPDDQSTYQVYVFQGLVSIERGDRKDYQDIHGLEKWLLQLAGDKGYEGIGDEM